MIKKRNKTIDYIKAILIVLVILGHSIQYGSGSTYIKNNLFYNNPIFQIIYSFHMPLFIMISGYLFYKTINKYRKRDIIKIRIKTLLIPIICWSIIPFILNINTINYYSKRELLKHIFFSISTNLWFLWALFYISIIIILIDKLKIKEKTKYIILLLIIPITYILPNNIIIYKYFIQLYLIGYLYPFFLLGYMYNNNKIKEKLLQIKNYKLTMPILIILFIILILLFNKNTYIYITQLNILNTKYQIINNIHRLLIGFIGSIITIHLISKVKVNNIVADKLSYLGQNTLGIYIISSYIQPNIIPIITKGLTKPNYFITIIISIITLLISILILELIKKSNILSKFLLGETKKRS